MDVMPSESAAPGQMARLGHGDAMHVTDIDPNRPGMEIYMVHEGGRWAPYGYTLRDAKTGELLYGGYTGRDTGRGMVGDIDPTQPGLETWANTGVGLWTAAGEKLGSSAPGTNMNIKWAADMTTQIVDGAGNATPTIQDWKKGTVLTAEGTRTNNGTKGNPSLVADIFGDWREELLVRTADSSSIRMYLSTEVTNHKLYTLMHDTQYRAEVARQSTTYNQPSYTSFYLGSDIDWAKVPVTEFIMPGVLSALEKELAELQKNKELTAPLSKQLENSLKQVNHHLEKGSKKQAIKFMEKFVSEIHMKNNEAYLSSEGKLNLTNKAQIVINMLKNN
jgi:hypothetical protein